MFWWCSALLCYDSVFHLLYTNSSNQNPIFFSLVLSFSLSHMLLSMPACCLSVGFSDHRHHHLLRHLLTSRPHSTAASISFTCPHAHSPVTVFFCTCSSCAAFLMSVCIPLLSICSLMSPHPVPVVGSSFQPC